MSENILEMRSITKTFPGVKALEDVTLGVKRGEIHAICGENGAGKSTLMKVLSGVYPFGTYTGDIYFDGQVEEFGSINDSEARGIVIIHQELALSPFLSVAENIFMGNEVKKNGFIDWHKTNAEAAKLLARVGLDENPTTPVNQLGVGKQQLIEIAKALSKRVKLLILDEPTAALNDNDSAHLLDLLRHLRGQGITCIIISHKLNEIEEIADTTTIIRDGKSIETMEMDETASQDRIIRSMVGRSLESRFPEHESKVGEEVFSISNWSVHHPTQQDRVVVDNASINVKRGEVVGIAGLMGAGRTELAMSVFGRSYGSKVTGQVKMDGKEVHLKNVSDAIDAGIAYVSEDRKHYGLNLIQDIRTNTSAAALKKLANKFGFVNENEELRIAEQYRKQMRTKTPNVHALVGKLSGGNQQKVVLSKWMYTDPELLILDEPTRGIDVGAKYEIYQIINELADQGKGVLVISSELPELLGICDRIYALSFGRITGCVDRADATQENLMELMTKVKD